ncbi:sensor histidine kinase [Actinomadura yumaensis]|uniref:histidine kinase n=1 Tax=Actinomadura yumaensis TaxID=111807 RepID=A0ABW2CVT2_9ACTN
MHVPEAPAAGLPVLASAAAVRGAGPDLWPEVCERFCLQLLVLAEKMRPAMDLLEREEEDPDRLEALYEIDHGVTRMRRAARDLRILAGRDDEEISGPDTSLLDVVRMAESSIEQYRQVQILRVVELAVPAYAAEDLASLVAALLDNATRYSPAAVTVSAHLLDNGGVMLRIEDSGIGMSATQVETLNATLSGPVPAMSAETARQTGFPVVHRLARRHGVGVRLAAKTGGTVAMVTIPASLLCEIQAEEARPAGAPPEMAHLTMAHRAERPAPVAPPVRIAPDGAEGDADLGGLPRRERTSLRPVGTPRAADGGTAAPPSPADPSTGNESFAADLEAFKAGTRRLDDEHADEDGREDEREEGRP